MKRRRAESVFKWIETIRRSRKLHSTVEDRLIDLLKRIAPDYHSIKEPVGLAGGRNDLMLFEFSGKKVLLELFATRSQVSRDLRILDKTDAEVKIAIVIDKEIDATVFNAFIRENPEDNYPFLFVSELFRDPPTESILKLRQLIFADEDAKFERMLRTKISKAHFLQECQNEGIEVLTKDDIDTGNITFTKIFITMISDKCIKYGMARNRVKKLAKWMSKDKCLHYILTKISAGMNVILYTNFEDNFGVYSDIELADFLRMSYQLSEPKLMLPLNAIVSEILEKYFEDDTSMLGKHPPKMYIGSSQIYETETGRQTVFSLPKNVIEITMLRPMQDSKHPNDYLAITKVR
ncbi:MAG: hypothetical protein ACLQPD_35395 [Desulfomonilaceae bacterium]